MFGSKGMSQYRQGKQDHATLPHREVADEAEFLACCSKAGMSADEALEICRMCAAMGSSTRIGNEILSIKQSWK